MWIENFDRMRIVELTRTAHDRTTYRALVHALSKELAPKRPARMDGTYVITLAFTNSWSHIVSLKVCIHIMLPLYLVLHPVLSYCRDVLLMTSMHIISFDLVLKQHPRNCCSSRCCSTSAMFFFHKCFLAVRLGNTVLVNCYLPCNKNTVKLAQTVYSYTYKTFLKYFVFNKGQIMFCFTPEKSFDFINASFWFNVALYFLWKTFFVEKKNSKLVYAYTYDQFSENRFVNCSAETALRFFLEDHIEKGLMDGFDDNVSRHGITNIFELPSGEVWWKVVCRLYKCIMENVEVKEGTSTGKLSQILPSLKTMMGTDVKFSEIKCSKVLPLAIAAYQEGLPSHYTKEHHETKLAHAVALFSMHARGSMVEKYLAKLEEECVTIWGKGRRMCETLSLTGNPCINSIHRLPQEEKTDEEKSLPVMDHSSGVRMVAACNCGRKQGPREDPFDLKAANLYIYDLMEIDCCSHLEHVDLDISFKKLIDILQLFVQYGSEGIFANVRITYQILLAIAVSTASNVRSFSKLKLILTRLRSDQNERLVDIVPYLGQPTDLVSSFSSWSLKCVGPSSYYSHNIGLSDMMPGFLAHTGFLLPWDVAVKIEHAEKWPTILESSRRHRSGRTDKYSKNLKSEAEFTVKIFIGEEYECPRGHRFICCAPEKALRAPTTGVKETAVKIIAWAIAYLWLPCFISRVSNKSLIAQLMRIHIVTPKAPVTVTLDPHIRFGTDMQGITFVTGKKEAIKLSQSAYWILRLPYPFSDLFFHPIFQNSLICEAFLAVFTECTQ
nr:EOG090X02WG [Artemia franciscana]